MNPFGVPGIDVHQFQDLRQTDSRFILLDVREPMELELAPVPFPSLNVPLSTLAKDGVDALPPELTGDQTTPIVVLCHHGSRSAQVTAWLRGHGWEDVTNLDGGIHAYAKFIDPSIPTY